MVFVSNGGSIQAVQDDPESLFLPLVFGLIAGFGIGPLIIIVRWALGKMPKEIRANINDEGVKVLGENVNFEAKWPTTKWVRESSSAYRIKFKGMLVRLPKRGFTSEQEASFRSLVLAMVPTPSNRLKP